MLIIEPRMVIIFWTGNPISFKHISFWYLFLKRHQTTYHSDMGVLSRKVTEEGLSTLVSNYVNAVKKRLAVTKSWFGSYLSSSIISISLLNPMAFIGCLVAWDFKWLLNWTEDHQMDSWVSITSQNASDHHLMFIQCSYIVPFKV